MTDLNSIKSMLEGLECDDLEELSAFLLEKVTDCKVDTETSSWVSCGEILCTSCGSINFVRNGMVKGKQRYLCRDCSKTFGFNSQSIISATKLLPGQWNEYIKCMIGGLSIRESAARSGMSVKSSFYIRHKILDAINLYMGRESISGIAELDETFVAESFKGNHKKSGFTMPRAPRKRGGEVTKRGISKEQICIGTAIDKTGNTIMEMACKGRITSRKLENLYTGYVSEGTTVCTDSLSSYKTLSRKLKLSHKQIPSGKYSIGTFSLSSVNSLHSRYKKWMERFNGVSTKFLPNYLTWFKWLEKTKGMMDSAKTEKMWTDAMAKHVDVKVETIRKREPIWIENKKE